MEWLRTEGIVMQMIPFQDADAIFTAYTPDLGFAKFVLKYAMSSRQREKGVPSPLTLTEFIYRRTNSDLFSCKEASVLETFNALRDRLNLMEAGGLLLQALHQSQPPGKASDKLYRLLLAYLDKLPQVDDPKVLVGSFKLKILRYEGVLVFRNQCSACDALLNDMYYSFGDFFCPVHRPEGGIHFDPEEAKMVFVMGLAQSLVDLKHLVLTTTLEEKVDFLFKEFVH